MFRMAPMCSVLKKIKNLSTSTPVKWRWSLKTCYGLKSYSIPPCKDAAPRPRRERNKWAKRVWVRMQRSAPFHPEMFISLIPTEGKCTPLELMVGWANFSRLCTHTTHTHRCESTECLKGGNKKMMKVEKKMRKVQLPWRVWEENGIWNAMFF